MRDETSARCEAASTAAQMAARRGPTARRCVFLSVFSVSASQTLVQTDVEMGPLQIYTQTTTEHHVDVRRVPSSSVPELMSTLGARYAGRGRQHRRRRQKGGVLSIAEDIGLLYVQIDIDPLGVLFSLTKLAPFQNYSNRKLWA
jgi:hypothetical protein